MKPIECKLLIQTCNYSGRVQIVHLYEHIRSIKPIWIMILFLDRRFLKILCGSGSLEWWATWEVVRARGQPPYIAPEKVKAMSLAQG